MEDMEIERRTTGELVDSLITASMKMFALQDKIMCSPDLDAGKMAKELQALNSRRNDLMRAITKRVDGKDNGSDKTYKA